VRIIEGSVYILGDDINTDDIVPSHTLTMRDSNEMAKYALEFIDPNFVQKSTKQKILIAGSNFGTGSSREEAVNVFKNLGIKAVIARSFARIYFRNLINNGIPGITLNWKDTSFSDADFIKIDLNKGNIENQTKNITLKFLKLPPFLTEIINEGGIIKKLQKRLQAT
jgi:3-isopropylmalate/(R)-2-methylmalate dehydratase small subunit